MWAGNAYSSGAPDSASLTVFTVKGVHRLAAFILSISNLSDYGLKRGANGCLPVLLCILCTGLVTLLVDSFVPEVTDYPVAF